MGLCMISACLEKYQLFLKKWQTAKKSLTYGFIATPAHRLVWRSLVFRMKVFEIQEIAISAASVTGSQGQHICLFLT